MQTPARDMSVERVRALAERVYAPDAYLNDSLEVVVGASAIEAYFVRALSEERKLSFAFSDTAVSRSGPDYYVRWAMTLRTPGLQDGAPITTRGASHFRFRSDGRVILHRDFWNPAHAFYERIPGLSWLIRRVRARL